MLTDAERVCAECGTPLTYDTANEITVSAKRDSGEVVATRDIVVCDLCLIGMLRATLPIAHSIGVEFADAND